MNSEEGQLNVFKDKGSCLKSRETVIGNILATNKGSQKCVELKVMHSSQLSSIEGIEKCKYISILNLSSNAILNILPLKHLRGLKVIDVKSNRIQSLKGLEMCTELEKLEASHNKLVTLEGLGETKSKLEFISICGNELDDLEELQRLKNFTKLKELYFQKKKASNPFCQDKDEYYSAIRQYFPHLKFVLKRLDDKNEEEIKMVFSQRERESASQSIQYDKNANQRLANTQQYENSGYVENKRNFMNTYGFNQHQSRGQGQSSQKMMIMTQRQSALQEIIAIKEEAIEQLRSKNSHLEMTNANFYKDSIKKEVEYERLYGQIAELSKHVDQKDAKINELHRRIEELLKVNSSANSLADNRSQEMEKLRKECGDYKIKNSELRALNKDQQNRLRELQNKALHNIEDKSQRIEQLRRKNEDLMKEHYQSQKQQEECKDRVRELTQLLREWEYKYEQKVKELEGYHNSQRGQIIREYEQKHNDESRHHEQAFRNIYTEFEQKIEKLEDEYEQALRGSVDRYNQIKKAYEERSASEAEMKSILKAVMSKNSDQEHTLVQCQQIIITSRKKINDLALEKEALIKQCSEWRSKYQIENKQVQAQVSKLLFEKNKMEKEIKQLRATNQYLQTNFEKLNYREKQMQQLEERAENLQIALDAKNVMLDDKNQTIENLKLDIQNIQKDQQNKIDASELDKIQSKYKKTKDKIKEYEEQIIRLGEENKDLNERLQTYNSMEQQFGELRDIMSKQQNQLNEKKENIVELIQTLQKLKKHATLLSEESSSLRHEKNRLLNVIDQKQVRWTRVLKDKQSEFERKLGQSQEEMNKYKSVAMQLKQLTNFTKNLQF